MEQKNPMSKVFQGSFEFSLGERIARMDTAAKSRRVFA